MIRQGRVADGMTLLDEAMVSVVADEVSPVLAGDIYCSVLEACREVFDWRRAREWTASLTQWCGSQPDLVRYRGECLIYPAEILQLQGAGQRRFGTPNRRVNGLRRLQGSRLSARRSIELARSIACAASSAVRTTRTR